MRLSSIRSSARSLASSERQRLVHQVDRRPPHQRPADRDPLHLAARELRRLGCRACGRCAASPPPRATVRSISAARQRAQRRAQRKGQVLAHRQVRVERILLEHHRHVALRRGLAHHVAAADGDAARVRRLEPGDQPQRRGLAGAGRPEQHHEGAVGNGHASMSLHRGDVAEALADPAAAAPQPCAALPAAAARAAARSSGSARPVPASNSDSVAVSKREPRRLAGAHPLARRGCAPSARRCRSGW